MKEIVLLERTRRVFVYCDKPIIIFHAYMILLYYHTLCEFNIDMLQFCKYYDMRIFDNVSLELSLKKAKKTKQKNIIILSTELI